MRDALNWMKNGGVGYIGHWPVRHLGTGGGRMGNRDRCGGGVTTDCFSSVLTSFLPPCKLLLKLSIVRMISFLRASSARATEPDGQIAPQWQAQAVCMQAQGLQKRTSCSSSCA